MGIFDAVKNRLGRGDAQEEYANDNQYYEEEELYEPGYEDSYAQGNYDDASDSAVAASNRTGSVFDNYTPLVSMSDVRSQELPSYAAQKPAARSQSDGQYRTSLPYVGNPADDLEQRRETIENNNRRRSPSARLDAEGGDNTRIYDTENSGDPLLQRHSLSNTGDFSSTSPAYYASRSGVGHVRPSGQARRNHKFREAVVIRPESYDEVEQVANNIKRGNAVVLVLTQTRPELAKRILDFSFGAAAVSDGQVVSIGERIYALTVEHELTQTELELLQARGII